MRAHVDLEIVFELDVEIKYNNKVIYYHYNIKGLKNFA